MKTSVVGLGAMGAGIAGNLEKAGLLHGAWNRTAANGEKAAAEFGFPFTADLAAAVSDADVVITSVSMDGDLIEISEKLAELLKPGTIVVDTSTVAQATAVKAAEIFAAKQVGFIDGPVSGGPEGAKKATMVMMLGGDAATIEKIKPVTDAISRMAIRMGDNGAGQATKAVNQIMVAGINQAVTEALAFGQASGLNMDDVIALISQGAAGNWFLEQRGPNMTKDIFTPGFKMVLHNKDLNICKNMAADLGVSLPVIDNTLSDYAALLEQGHGDDDISTLYRTKKAMFQK